MAKSPPSLMDSLDSMDAAELMALIAAAQERKDKKLEIARVELAREIREKVAALGLTVEQVLLSTPSEGKSPKKRATSGKVRVKYRGPNGEEWTGRGRLPKWVAAQEATGRKRDEFLVSDQA
jgi:DNA-binding protein H-NS